MQGNIHSIETFGSVDGPGVRFVIFLQGCHLRCRFCHNPETWCIHSDKAKLMDAEALLNKALRYKPYWGKEGGITVSGGEPLLQMDFMIELFTLAKNAGVNTVIDTAGQPFSFEEPFYSKFKKLMELTDLVMLDIKHIDREQHKKLTGMYNDNILAMAKELQKMHKPMWIRHVLVPGWTDDEPSLIRLAEFLRTFDNIEKTEVLPYHTLGVHKYAELGLPEPLPGVPPAEISQKKWAENILLFNSHV